MSGGAISGGRITGSGDVTLTYSSLWEIWSINHCTVNPTAINGVAYASAMPSSGLYWSNDKCSGKENPDSPEEAPKKDSPSPVPPPSRSQIIASSIVNVLVLLLGSGGAIRPEVEVNEQQHGLSVRSSFIKTDGKGNRKRVFNISTYMPAEFLDQGDIWLASAVASAHFAQFVDRIAGVI